MFRGTVAQHTPKHFRPASSHTQVANTGPRPQMKSGDYPEPNAGQHDYKLPLKKQREGDIEIMGLIWCFCEPVISDLQW